jgi:hypothetical protein
MPKFEPAPGPNPCCANFPRTAHFSEILAVYPLGRRLRSRNRCAATASRAVPGKVRFSIPEASTGRIFIAPMEIMYNYLCSRAIMSDL